MIRIVVYDCDTHEPLKGQPGACLVRETHRHRCHAAYHYGTWLFVHDSLVDAVRAEFPHVDVRSVYLADPRPPSGIFPCAPKYWDDDPTED